MVKDMTSGREWQVILFFTLPIIGSHLLQALYNLADALIVANAAGASALGAIGLTGSMNWLLLTVSVGLGAGVNIVTAQYYGAKRYGDIQASIGAAYVLSLSVSAVIAILCFFLARPLIFGFLAAPPGMREMSLYYFRICASGGIVFQMLYNVTYGILRAYGDSRGGLLFLLFGTTLNVCLDLLLVAFFRFGVAGAAVATVISQACCAAASMIYLRGYFPELRPRLSAGRKERLRARTIIRVSIPIIAQSAVFAMGFTVMQRFVNSFGPPSIEGYAAMGKLEELAHIPSNSFKTAVSSFVGQNVGAKKFDRARNGYMAAMKISAAITVALAIAVALFSKPMLGMFGISGESMRRGWEHLMLLMIFMPFAMTSNITSGFLQGAGDVTVPAAASLANLCVRLGATWLMARTFIDFRSVYFSMPPAWMTGCLIIVLRYRSGRWRAAGIT